MKLRRKLNKGFTLVELIVVIAIIAILAAVSAVSYIAFINQANKSADEQTVTQVNLALQAAEVNGKCATPTEAVEVAYKNGFVIENLTPTSQGYCYAWNSITNRFNIIEKDKVVYPADYGTAKEHELYKFVSTIEDGNAFSLYLKSDFQGELPETINYGIDCGDHLFETLNYKNTGSAQEVIIRTLGGKLTIDAPEDTVNHYGNAAEVFVERIDNASYHIFGTVNTLMVKQGHVKIENNAKVNNVIVNKLEDAIVSLDNEGTVDSVAGVDETVEVNGIEETSMITTTNTLTSNGGYVKFTENATLPYVSLTKDTIIDLNGKDITFNFSLVIRNIKVTIIDSNQGENKLTVNNLIQVNGGGKLIINSGYIYSTGELIRLHQDFIGAQEAIATINGGTLISDTDCVVYFQYGTKTNKRTLIVNGGYLESKGVYSTIQGHGTDVIDSSIIINGGEIINVTTAIAMYLPQKGSLTINGGYIKGNTAIYKKAGLLTITGGKIEAVGDKKDFVHSGSGAGDTGDAIVLESCSYPGGNVIAHTIQNATIISKNNKPVVGYVYYSYNTPSNEIPFIVINTDFVFDIYSAVKQSDSTVLITKIN